ncbi:GDSL-type esterase/lipase family protein [Planctomicrobium sp. SH664]|uniref:GDSL-type esterase/lipase family protein n=1 Tax=Planctomicrobium sp. SH664 TaxID=3448125 RepID=UPI003F5BC2BE
MSRAMSPVQWALAVCLISSTSLLQAENPTAPPAEQKGAAAAAKSLELPATDDGLPGAGPLRRTSSYQKKWKTRREQFAREAAQDHDAVVLLGDSITEGWKNLTTELFPGVKIANRGIGADTTRGMLYRLQDDVLSINPKCVVLLMGTNDLADGIKPSVVAGNLKLIVAALKKHDPKMPIIFCQIMPSAESKARPAALINEANKLCLQAIQGDPHITALDTWSLYATPTGDAPVELFPDLLHPNAAGYARFAAALRPLLATLGFMETEPDQFSVEPGFKSLFNGRDLTGWGVREKKGDDTVTPVGSVTATPDGRYVALNGRLIVTTPPEGRRVQVLWTTEEFPKDFVLRLEFRCTPKADSGVFIRKPQLQCRDYLTAGPYKELKKYKPQDWNEMEVVVKGETAYCTCNGEVLQEALKVPATGPIGLEGDAGQMEYRRIRIGQPE